MIPEFSKNNYFYFKKENEEFQEYGMSDVSYYVLTMNEFNNFQLARELLFQDTQNISVIEEYLDAYKTLLIKLEERLSMLITQDEEDDITEFLERYTLIDCAYTENDYNSLFLSETNPIVLVNKIQKYYLTENIENDGLYSMMNEEEIENLIMGSFNFRRIKSLYSNEVNFYISKDLVRDIKEMSTLNNINSITILDKIEAFVFDTHKKDLKIAYFGHFSDENQEELNIVTYLKQYSRQYGITLNMTQFVNNTMHIEYDFISCSKDGVYYNLNRKSDLEKLFTEYDMVLFLDEGHFYEEVYEIRPVISDYVDWYKKLIPNAFHKWAYLENWLKRNYECFMNIGNSFQFNSELYQDIVEMSKGKDCSVYIYNSQDDKICCENNEEIDLSLICNSNIEYHDGVEIKVIHVNEEITGGEIVDALNPKATTPPPPFSITIGVYDLLKHLCLYNENFPDPKNLRFHFLNWNFEKNMKNGSTDLDIYFHRSSPSKLIEYINIIFTTAFVHDKNPILSEYLKSVIVEVAKQYCSYPEQFIFINNVKNMEFKSCYCGFGANLSHNRKPLLATTCIHNIITELSNNPVYVADLDNLNKLIKKLNCDTLDVSHLEEILRNLKHITDIQGIHVNSLFQQNLKTLSSILNL